MCGIFACISRRGKPIAREKIIRAGNKMSHRGPDAKGILVNDWIGILHNRLSIIDLSKEANQPMFSPDKRYAIIYNGEIYNYKELRKVLINDGMEFKTHSDTEVLLNSYIRFSTGCLNKLRGMFAFVIVDFIKGEIIAARDCFGIKPLYIFQSDDYIIFSSEIKPFSEFIQLEPNYDSYVEQIMFRYTSGKNTCFKDIYELIPGNFYCYEQKKNKLEEYMYYRLKNTFSNNGKLNNKKENDIIHEAEEIITESIKAHTISDVGYNVQLSGGVDSSLIAAILSKKLNYSKLNTFSITFAEKECDESYYQNMVANQLGIKNSQIEMSNDIFSNILEEAVYFMEMPIIHIGCACLFYLTKYSILNSKVMLTGEGADELFGGYSRYRIPPRVEFFYALHNLGLDKVLYPFRDCCSKVKKIYRKINKNPLLEYTSFWSNEELEKLISKSYLAKGNLIYRSSLLSKNGRGGLHDLLLHYDQLTYLPSLLDRQDKMAMANSVETRVPYCDRRVYEFVNNIPAHLKFKNGELKYIVKKIAEEYLPKEVIYRKKIGLNLPLNEWLKNKKFLGRYLDILLDSTATKRDIYNHNYLHYMVRMQKEGKKDFSKQLMILVMFELWHRVFFDKNCND